MGSVGWDFCSLADPVKAERPLKRAWRLPINSTWRWSRWLSVSVSFPTRIYLATLAIPQYTNFMERARASEAVNTIGAIRTAEDIFFMENATYTATIGGTGLDIVIPTLEYWNDPVISDASATGYTVTMTRSDDPPGGTIILTFTTAGGSTWSGTHTGVPSN